MSGRLRKISDQELAESNARIVEEAKKQETPGYPLLIFRLADELFAIDPLVVAEVTPLMAIHTIPGRFSTVNMGVVNLHSSLVLCISLHNFLGLPQAEKENGESHQLFERMVAIQKGSEQWVFPVAEVLGIFSCRLDSMKKLAADLISKKGDWLKGIIRWNDQSVSFLDDVALFDGLRHYTQLK